MAPKSNEDSADKFEDKLVKMISIFITFGIIVCAIYLFAFWSSFGINILEFVSLSDFVKLGIYPVIVGSIGTVIGLIIGSMVPPDTINPELTKEEREELLRTKRRESIVRLTILFATSIAFALVGYFGSNANFWYYAGLAIVFAIPSFVEEPPFLESLIPNTKARAFATILFLSAFPIAFVAGKRNANEILHGESFQIVNTKTLKEFDSESFKNKKLLEGQDSLKYVGAAGDYFFFLSMDNSSIYAIKNSELHYLELKNYLSPMVKRNTD